MSGRGQTCPLNEGGLRLLSNAGNVKDMGDWLERVITQELSGTVKNAMFLTPYSRKLCGEIGQSQSWEQLLTDLSHAGWIEGSRVPATAQAALEEKRKASEEEEVKEQEARKKQATANVGNVKFDMSADKMADLQKRLAELNGKQTEVPEKKGKKPVAVVKKPVAVETKKFAVLNDVKVIPSSSTSQDETSEPIKFIVARNQKLMKERAEAQNLKLTQSQLDEICGSRFTVLSDKITETSVFVTLKNGSELEIPTDGKVVIFMNFAPKKQRKIEVPTLKKRLGQKQSKKEIRNPDPVKTEQKTTTKLSINDIRVQTPTNTDLHTTREAKTPVAVVSEKRKPETRFSESIRIKKKTLQEVEMGRLLKENARLSGENRKLNREKVAETKRKEIAQGELEKLKNRAVKPVAAEAIDGPTLTLMTEAKFRELVNSYPRGPRQLEIRVSSGLLNLKKAHLFLALKNQDRSTLAFDMCAVDEQTAKDLACTTAFEALSKSLPYKLHFKNQTQI